MERTYISLDRIDEDLVDQKIWVVGMNVYCKKTRTMCFLKLEQTIRDITYTVQCVGNLERYADICYTDPMAISVYGKLVTNSDKLEIQIEQVDGVRSETKNFNIWHYTSGYCD